MYEENQNVNNFGKAFSEMTKKDYESLLADLDEMEVMLDDFDKILDGNKIRHDAFEGDDVTALIHYASPYYDPVYAHEYYMAHRQLKGRQKSAYQQLNKVGRKEAQLYKKDRNKERDSKINTSAEATKKNLEKIKEKTKLKRAQLKAESLSEIHKTSEAVKGKIANLTAEFNRKVTKGISGAEYNRIRNEYKTRVALQKNELAGVKKSLEDAYRKSSNALSLNKKASSDKEKADFDRIKVNEMKSADNDYTDYIERLTSFNYFVHDSIQKMEMIPGEEYSYNTGKHGVAKIYTERGSKTDEKYFNTDDKKYNYGKQYDTIDAAKKGSLDNLDKKIVNNARFNYENRRNRKGSSSKAFHSDSESGEQIYCSMYSRNAELYHHGIKGQKWGEQNGPPYPLDSSISTGSRLKEKEEKRAMKLEAYKEKQKAIDKKKHERELNSLNKYTEKNAEKIEKAKSQGNSEKVNKLISNRDRRLTSQAISNGLHAMNNKALNELTYEEMKKEKNMVAIIEAGSIVGSLLASVGLTSLGISPAIAAVASKAPVFATDKQQIRENIRMKNYQKKHPDE